MTSRTPRGLLLATACATGWLAACSFDTASYNFTDEPATPGGGGAATGGSGGSTAGSGGATGGKAGAPGGSGGASGGKSGSGGAGAAGAPGGQGGGGASGKAGASGMAGTSGNAGTSGKAGSSGVGGSSGAAGAAGTGGAAGMAGQAGGGAAGEAGMGGAAGTGGGGMGGSPPTCTVGTTICMGKDYVTCPSGSPVTTSCGPSETCDPTDGCISPIAIYAGARHACVRMSDDTAVCWGGNDHGQVGNGTMGGNAAPSRVETSPGNPLRNVKQLALGDGSTCALIDDGVNAPKVVCWGTDQYGSLGDGAADSSRAAPALNKPVILPGLDSVATGSIPTIAAGGFTACAIGASGAVYCWGAGDQGQLGNNTATASSGVPVTVQGVTGASTLGVGLEHVCAIGTVSPTGMGVACWGNEWIGQLGNGVSDGFSEAATAQAVKGGPSIQYWSDAATTISVGGYMDGTAGYDWTGTSCAVRQGAVACWGGGWSGQIGDGTYMNRAFATSTSGVAASPLNGVTVAQVGVTWGHVCARAASGSVYCWGSNLYGELDLPVSTVNSNLPVAIPVMAADLAVGSDSAVGNDGQGGIEIDPQGFACVLTPDTPPVAKCWGANQAGQQGPSGQAATLNTVDMP